MAFLHRGRTQWPAQQALLLPEASFSHSSTAAVAACPRGSWPRPHSSARSAEQLLPCSKQQRIAASGLARACWSPRPLTLLWAHWTNYFLQLISKAWSHQWIIHDKSIPASAFPSALCSPAAKCKHRFSATFGGSQGMTANTAPRALFAW